QESKAYRVDPKAKTPYHHFLLEHARKWGASVCSENVEIKSGWTLFQISQTIQSSRLILNGMGGGRVIAKSIAPKLSEKMKYWMYLDPIECPLAFIPEPLQEFSQIDFGDAISNTPSHRFLHLSVDRIRSEARLSLGSWLPFDDTKNWVSQIEKGRAALKKIIPFLPESTFKNIPPLLELTELRGECIRRGQTDRLTPEVGKEPAFKRFLKNFAGRFPVRQKPRILARRVYSVSPHYLPFRNRLSSFEESLNFLDYFERKKRKQLKAS
ncbi:MAG: hypothetical protein JWQ35_855, partial [Bacteriovoracaceae bacterium]|nr:hypothetical protein [Bacteriovoracaceae bacterium]